MRQVINLKRPLTVCRHLITNGTLRSVFNGSKSEVITQIIGRIMTENTDIPTLNSNAIFNENPKEIRSLNIADLSLSSKVKVTWSFVWRGLVAAIASTLSGGIVGFIVGGFMGGFFSVNGTLSPDLIKYIQIVCGSLGVVVGVIFYYLYVKWLLTSKLGAYRLLLVAADS